MVRRFLALRSRFGIVLGACLLFPVAGCALPELAWERADNVVLGRTNDWLDLEPRQESLLQTRLQPWLRDVRRHRLGEVADAIDELAARIQGDIERDDVGWAERRFRALYNDIIESFLPVITPTLAGITDSQRRHLADRFEEENREDREHLIEGRDGGRYALAERMIEQIERWTGSLGLEQRELIHARVRDFPDTAGSWLDYRRRMQQRLLAALEAGAPAGELETLLHRWWIERAGRTPRESRDAVAFRSAVRGTLVEVGRSLTPMQRAEARRRLRDRAELLRQLTESVP